MNARKIAPKGNSGHESMGTGQWVLDTGQWYIMVMLTGNLRRVVVMNWLRYD